MAQILPPDSGTEPLAAVMGLMRVGGAESGSPRAPTRPRNSGTAPRHSLVLNGVGIVRPPRGPRTLSGSPHRGLYQQALMAGPFVEPVVVDGDPGGRPQRNDDRLDISGKPGGAYILASGTGCRRLHHVRGRARRGSCASEIDAGGRAKRVGVIGQVVETQRPGLTDEQTQDSVSAGEDHQSLLVPQ